MRTVTDIDTLIGMSVKGPYHDSVPCSIECEIEGRLVKVYDASIQERDILLYTDRGWFNYMVDTYGDNHTIQLYDYGLS